jgi:lipopolysaccharide/colanic/teichoic acid biosynthesis glycosyltransferase
MKANIINAFTLLTFAQHLFKEEKSGLPDMLQRGLSLIAILLLSPIFLLSMLAIRLNSKGSVIFKQVRVGEQGRLFVMYKFRSMYLPSDSRYQAPGISDRNGVCEKFYHDPRISSVGKIIRKLSIDELPQLFNVLMGDMALIGPRPALPKEVNQYQHYMLQRLDVKPGITGLWQVSGRADISFLDQIKLDVTYIKERSLLMDLKILFATIPAVITGRGAY